MSRNWQRLNSSLKHGGQRRRLSAGGYVRVTKKGRRLTDQERAEVVKKMRAEGRLGPEVR
jgi:hypothetical protein